MPSPGSRNLFYGGGGGGGGGGRFVYVCMCICVCVYVCVCTIMIASPHVVIKVKCVLCAIRLSLPPSLPCCKRLTGVWCCKSLTDVHVW